MGMEGYGVGRGNGRKGESLEGREGEIRNEK